MLYHTIKDAFKDSSMFPSDLLKVKKKMQKYYKTQSIESTLLELPQLTISQFEQSMTEIAFKAKHVLSSPTYIKIETICYNIISLLLKGEQYRVQSKMLFC